MTEGRLEVVGGRRRISRIVAGVGALVSAIALTAISGAHAHLGHGLPPYRWVDPPEALAARNLPPLSGRETIPQRNSKAAFTVPTGDGQAQLALTLNSFEADPTQESIRVDIRPVDPAAIGPPPDGFAFDGNAYRFEAVYLPSRSPAPLSRPVSVVLLHPGTTTELLQSDGGAWAPVASTAVPDADQVFAATTTLGYFVAAGPAAADPSVMVYAIAGSAVALAAGFAWSRRRRPAATPPSRRGGRPRGR